MHYIYKITNLINNKIYIGQTKHPEARWRDHKYEAKKDNPNMIISKALKKYGIENFIFEVIVSVLPTGDENEDYKRADDAEELLIEQEQSHVNLGKGYNVSRGGSTSPKTEEWKQYMSERMTKRWENYSEEFKQETIERLIRIAPNEHSFSEENKTNLRRYVKEMWADENHRQKMSALMKERMKERMNDPAEKEKRRIAFSGENNPRHRSKGPVTSPMKGKHHSEEAKQNLSEIFKGRRRSPATEFKPGHGKVIFTPEQEKAICDDYQTMSGRQLSIKYKTTRKILMAVVKKHNIPLHDNSFNTVKGKEHIKISPEQERAICEDYLKVTTMEELIKKHNYSRYVLTRVLTKHNIPLHHTGKVRK
jgi:group I intron endonuclease